MRTHILLQEQIAPGTVTFDDLVLDPELPMEAQADDLKEDLFMAEFPNGCILDIGWYPSFNPSGQFTIAINQQGEIWDPFLHRSCRTILELKATVMEFVDIISRRPTIRPEKK